MIDNQRQIKEKGSTIFFSHFKPCSNLLNMAFLITFLFMSCQEEKIQSGQVPQENQAPIASQEEKKSNKKVILFYGDSLTAGFGLEENQSFPSKIEDKIDSLGLDYNVVNAGLSGETTSGGLKRIDWVMKQKVDLFFLALGANDMLRGLPLEETKKNLSEIISKVKTKNPNVKIGLCEMIAAPNMGADYVKKFNKIYKDLASEFKVDLVPFFLEGVAGQEKYLLKDGKHPNAQGQVIVANNIWKSLEGML